MDFILKGFISTGVFLTFLLIGVNATVASNTDPVISCLPNFEICSSDPHENTLVFCVNDVETDAGNLQVIVQSADPNCVDVGTVDNKYGVVIVPLNKLSTACSTVEFEILVGDDDQNWVSTTLVLALGSTGGSPQIEISADKEKICVNDFIQFSISNVSDEGSSPSYIWFVDTEQKYVGPTFTFYPTTEGQFEVYCQLVSSLPCTDAVSSDAITIHAKRHPEVIAKEPAEICLGNCAVIEDANYDAEFFEWSPSAYISSPYKSITDVCPLITTTYTLKGWWQDFCYEYSTVTIGVTNDPIQRRPDNLINQQGIGGDAVELMESGHLFDKVGNNYVFGTTTTSQNGDLGALTTYGAEDVYVRVFDDNLDLICDRVIGGSGSDHVMSIKGTRDQGLIITGYTESNDGDFNFDGPGDKDIFIAKLKDCDIEWITKLGGRRNDFGTDVIQTLDGGYLITSYSHSDDVDMYFPNFITNGYDAYIIKVSPIGAVEWIRPMGGDQDDIPTSVIFNPDLNEYIIAGSSNSSDLSVPLTGGKDFWVRGLNMSGLTVWENLYGGTGDDVISSIVPTQNGYVILGTSDSPTIISIGDNDNPNANPATSDVVLFKIDYYGTLLQGKFIGGKENEVGYSLRRTTDGGYAIGASTTSNGSGYVPLGNQGGSDMWLVKTNQAGVVQWSVVDGQSDDEIGNTLFESNTGAYGYIAVWPNFAYADKDIVIGMYDLAQNCGNFADKDGVLCVGQTLYTSVPYSRQNMYTYQWFVGSTLVSTTPNLSYQFNSIGNYLVTVRSRSIETGCEFECSQSITVYSMPVVSLGSNLYKCASVNTTLTPTVTGGSGSGVTYQWSGGGVTATTQQISVNPTVTTTYTLTVRDQLTGCTGSSTVTINVVNFSFQQPLTTHYYTCLGTPVNLGVSLAQTFPGVTFNWSPSTYLSATNILNPTANPTTAGNYTYNISASFIGGCPNTLNQDIIVSADPKPSISSSNVSYIPTTCATASDGGIIFTPTVMNVSGVDYNYEIKLNGTTVISSTNVQSTAAQACTTLAAGTGYCLIITDLKANNGNGCVNNNSCFSFDVVYGGPVVTICPSPLPCSASTGDITIDFLAIRQNPTGSGTFDFEVREHSTGNLKATGTASFSTQVSNFPVSGVSANQNYDLILTVSGTNVCEFTQSFLVKSANLSSMPQGSSVYVCNDASSADIPIIISHDATASCFPQWASVQFEYKLQIDALGNGSWQDVSVSNQGPSYTYTYLPVGKYQVLISPVSPSFFATCTIPTAFFEIISTSHYNIDLQIVDPLCNGSSDGIATAFVSGGSGHYTYEWKECGGTTVLSTTNTVQGLSSGIDYCVQIQDVNNLCSAISPHLFQVVDPPLLEITYLDGSQCVGTCTVAGGTPGYTVNWYKYEEISQYEYNVTNEFDPDPLPPGSDIFMTDPYYNSSGPAEGVPWAEYDNSLHVSTVRILVHSGHLTGGTDLTATYSNIINGEYDVEVVDANGCVVSSPLTVYHVVDPRDYNLCFKWKSRVAPAKVEPPTPSIMFNLGAIAASSIRNAIADKAVECALAASTKVKEGFAEACYNVENVHDRLSMSYPVKLEQVTLYYYDRAGNLVRTVPPEGVDLVNQAHTFITGYEYNSLHQLKYQKTPDAGESEFVYDTKNQLRFSQNAQQKIDGTFSYSNYDELGRLIETGKIAGTYPPADPEANISSALGTEQTITVFSEPSGGSYLGEPQRFLQNRVSYTYTTDLDGNTHYTNYSYDPHGNVEWLTQEIQGGGTFTVKYFYDLISNKVKEVRLNEKRNDQFFHRYEYDTDNRITRALTSRDGYLWDKDASYSYYDHGPLRRIEIGEDHIQGIDYVYTIEGWLKAINSATLDVSKDFGKDGDHTLNSFAADVFGSVLGYYEGDFNRSYNSINSVLHSSHNSHLGASTGTLGQRNLYNGNISTWASQTLQPSGFQSPDYKFGDAMTGEKYTYDRLNRLRSSDFYAYNSSNSTWGSSAVSNNQYSTSYQYDKNGNINSLTRNGYDKLLSGNLTNNMDEFTYNYYSGTNKLKFVADAGTDALYYDANQQVFQNPDIQSGQSSSGNYLYDSNGNLIKDLAESIYEIKWTLAGKVSDVIPEDITGRQRVKYSYDAMGNRIKKQVYEAPYVSGNLVDEFDPLADPTTIKTTYYVKDAQGNTLATYKRVNEQVGTSDYFEASLAPMQNDMYGSSRLGILNVPSDESLKIRDYFKAGEFDAVSFDNDPLTRTTTFDYLIQASEQNDLYNGTTPAATDNYIPSARINKLNTATTSLDPQTDFFIGKTANNISQYREGSNAVYAATLPEYWGQQNVTLILNQDFHLLENVDQLNAFQYDPDAKGMFVKNPVNTDILYYFNRDTDGDLFASTVDLSVSPYGAVVNNEINLQINSGQSVGRHFAVAVDENRKISYLYFTSNLDGTTSIRRVKITESGPDLDFPEKVGEYASYDDLGNGELQFSSDGKWLSVYNGLEQQGWFDARESQILSFKVGGDFLPAAKKYTDSQGEMVTSIQTVKQDIENGNVAKGSLDFGVKGQHLFYNQHTLALIPNSSNDPVNAFAYQKLLLSTAAPFVMQEDGKINDLRRSPDYSLNSLTFNMLSTGDNTTPSIYSWNQMGYYDNVTASTTVLGSMEGHSAGYLPAQPHIINAQPTVPSEPQNRLAGNKDYELTDHLGNVRATVSDRKIGYTYAGGAPPTGQVANLTADLKSVNNYYPGGMLMVGRQFSSLDYHFGFNGVEKVNEVSGASNHYQFKFREYDPRVGRFWSVDPLFKIYPWNSTYAFAENKVINGIDLEGKEYAENYLTEMAQAAIENPATFIFMKPELKLQTAIQLYRNRASEVHNFITIPSSLQTVKIESKGEANKMVKAYYLDNKLNVYYNSTNDGVEDAVSVIFHEAIHYDTDQKNMYPYDEPIPTGDFEEMEGYSGEIFKLEMRIPPSNASNNELRSYSGEIGLNKNGFTNITQKRIDKIYEEITNYSNDRSNAESIEQKNDLSPSGKPN